MINSLAIRNFQSLHHVDIDLARFTVILGPSSSGKSALTRALRLLTSNARGTAFVSTGARTATVTAQTDRGTVSISRGASNEYTIIPLDSPQKTFTKLAAAVPEEVTEFLSIAPADPLNFSSQFDKPYLLSDTPSEVARTLGALTNVNVVFEASREANRRRLAISATLKLRNIDAEQLAQSLELLPSVTAQSAALDAASQLITEAEAIHEEFLALSATADTLRTAAASLQSMKPSTPPDIATLISTHSSLKSLTQSVAALQSSIKSLRSLTEARAAARQLVETSEEEFAQALTGLSADIASRLRTQSVEDLIAVPVAADISANYFTELLDN